MRAVLAREACDHLLRHADDDWLNVAVAFYDDSFVAAQDKCFAAFYVAFFCTAERSA